MFWKNTSESVIQTPDTDPDVGKVEFIAIPADRELVKREAEEQN